MKRKPIDSDNPDLYWSRVHILTPEESEIGTTTTASTALTAPTASRPRDNVELDEVMDVYYGANRRAQTILLQTLSPDLHRAVMRELLIDLLIDCHAAADRYHPDSFSFAKTDVVDLTERLRVMAVMYVQVGEAGKLLDAKLAQAAGPAPAPTHTPAQARKREKFHDLMEKVTASKSADELAAIFKPLPATEYDNASVTLMLQALQFCEHTSARYDASTFSFNDENINDLKGHLMVISDNMDRVVIIEGLLDDKRDVSRAAKRAKRNAKRT